MKRIIDTIIENGDKPKVELTLNTISAFELSLKGLSVCVSEFYLISYPDNRVLVLELYLFEILTIL